MTKTIGETNGMWAILLKIQLVLMVPALGLLAWLVQGQVLDNQFRGEGARFTAEDAKVQTELLVAQIDTRLARIETRMQVEGQIKPADVYRRLEQMEKKLLKEE